VGSLFHEAMKFRENLYQHTVYGPKVRALRAEAGTDTDGIFREFEKILAAAAIRLEEALQETEALFALTRSQFRVLLAAHRDNGLVTRYLIENAPLVGEVFSEGLDPLLASIHGSAARGYTLAARSYLESGYFSAARATLQEALARGGHAQELQRLAAYAEGMDAYLEGRYRDAISNLERWVSLRPDPEERAFADLARAAVSRVSSLVEGPDAEQVVAAAAGLVGRLQPLGTSARA
jgi:tetratricopeptide (TPR) repeat protein